MYIQLYIKLTVNIVGTSGTVKNADLSASLVTHHSLHDVTVTSRSFRAGWPSNGGRAVRH